MYGKGMMDPSRESGLGSESDNMAELAALLNTEIPEGQSNLMDSFTNLERVADYCEGNYFQAENKRYALEETKNYTTQSLASVAYQINTLAYNFLQLLNLQTTQLEEMEAQMNHIDQTVMIHKEKVARREIGVLTANKTTNRQYKIIAPANPEKPIKYVRKPIDFNGMMDPSRESGLGSESDNMAELAALLNTEIPEGQSNLMDSFTNLERVADYCEGNYFQAENKRYALEETKNYTTQSLASVAYQINTLAYNFLQLLNLQTTQLEEMEAQMNHIDQTVMIHKEKVARREIGVLTANKTTNRQYKIIAPANPEKPIKYVRKPIDFNALDDIGHGARIHDGGWSSGRGIKSRSSSQTTVVGPAPTTKPPTPPSALRSATGSLGKSSREYRTPPAVAPPQNRMKGDQVISGGSRSAPGHAAMEQSKVPSHYAPNYPVGHPRRTGAGYSTLPLAHQQQVASPPPPSQGYTIDHHMPPPPSPLILSQQHVEARSSPPLPPPPAPIDHPFGSSAMPIVTDELDLPGWVPKNYIEKVVAIYDYYADKEDELSFQESAVIYVLKKNDDGWWEGVMDGITGLFPGNYVEPCV